MGKLVFKVIKTKSQYFEYCKELERLLSRPARSREAEEAAELLTLLIEKWDEDHHSFDDLNPVELLHSLMAHHNLKARDLVKILGVSKGLVSDMLHYKKGISKRVIRVLSEYFGVSQEAFNRPYKLRITRTYSPVSKIPLAMVSDANVPGRSRRKTPLR